MERMNAFVHKIVGAGFHPRPGMLGEIIGPGWNPAPTLILMALMFFPFWLHADSPQDLFKRGNALYAEGKFAEAATAYQSAHDQGLHHWALFYNLGDAYYKTGQTGKAIANFERAFRLNSSQRDVIFNLNLSSAKAGDPVVPQSALPALAWRLFYGLSINTLTLWVSLFFFGGIGTAAWLLIAKKSFPAELMAAGALAFILSSFWLGTRIYLLERPMGVVTASPAEVRSGPNTTYPANFTVPEGRHVLLLEEEEPVQGWVEIGVPQEGLKGWVPDTAIEVL
jgi:hypothetical protein